MAYLSHKLSTHRQHDLERGALFIGNLSQTIDEALALFLIATASEQLLELIDEN